MYLAIIGNNNQRNYSLLDKKLNDLMETSQCFLFTILGGYIEGQERKQTLGEKWAEEYGLPVFYISAKTTDELVRKLILKADYAIFLLDNNPLIRNIAMQYKMSGKHGTIIKTPL